MPTSYKGRGQKEKQQVPVPITAALAALLAELKGDRADDAPLLRKSDGSRWLEINKSEHWNLFRTVAVRAGFDPDLITSYALRHSSICRALLNAVPVSVVAKLHDTSSAEIEAHYAAYILDQRKITEAIINRFFHPDDQPDVATVMRKIKGREGVGGRMLSAVNRPNICEEAKSADDHPHTIGARNPAETNSARL